ncbi:g-protein coupled receptor [Holotrichia oblita]|uniref:G-protein coupled receptor n=1 Tax=Holotrichia oblita TaxID=644536 RepID=A0ACB9T8M8_HOLOL|nr:g-protein coupled receptor [Holotrichia oblita]
MDLETYSFVFGVLFSLLFVIGLIGNICVCIVIIYNKTMQTSTNCYLFALAVSDIVIIICDLNSWILACFDISPNVFGRSYCLFEVFLAEFAIHNSLLIVTAVNLARYIAICHPHFRYNMINNVPKTIIIIIAITVLASCLAIPSAISELESCNTASNEIIITNLQKFITSLWMLLLYSGLVIFICVIYKLISTELKGSILVTTSTEPDENRKVIRMLAIVVVALCICWTPLQVFRPMYHFLGKLHSIAPYIEILCGFLFYSVSTTINPILYNIVSYKFRKAFKEIFLRRRSNDQVMPKRYTVKTEFESLSLVTKSSENTSNMKD